MSVSLSFHIVMEAVRHAPLLPSRPATIATSSSSLSLLTLDSGGGGGGMEEKQKLESEPQDACRFASSRLELNEIQIDVCHET
jgi:hypothetical protein